MILLLMLTKVAEGKEATMFQFWLRILTLKSTLRETEGLLAIRLKQYNKNHYLCGTAAIQGRCKSRRKAIAILDIFSFTE